jgi:hypothetical protein
MRARLVIAVGFAAAIAIVPVAASLSSENTPSGSERSVAGCLPFTEICFPDPAPLNPVETPAPAPPPANLPNTAPVVDANSPIDLDVENESGAPAPAPPPADAPPPIIRFVIPSD